MIIKVLRDYSGEEGTGVDRNVVAGSEHKVTRARGAALKANDLVEILTDEAEEGDVSEAPKPPTPLLEKQAPAPPNKAAPTPRNKAR